MAVCDKADIFKYDQLCQHLATSRRSGTVAFLLLDDQKSDRNWMFYGGNSRKKTRICILKIDAKHHEKSGVSYSKSRPAPHCRVLPPDICWMLHDDSCNCFHVAMVTNNPGDRKQQLALYRRCAVKTENQHAALLGWKFSSICVWPLRYLKFADTAYCRRLCHRVWGCYLSWTVTLWERHDGVQA